MASTSIHDKPRWTLYSDEETPAGSGVYKLKLKETYSNMPLPYRVKPGRLSRPEYGRNDELNLVIVADVPGQEDVPADVRLKRRILLTASRPRGGSPRDDERTVRFVTYTYYDQDAPTPKPIRSNGESDEGGAADAEENKNAQPPQQAQEVQAKQADSIDDANEVRMPVAGVVPCSDYPDDAVLIETEINLPNEPTDPTTIAWLDYSDWD